MTRVAFATVLLAAIAALPTPARAAGPLQRYALVVGANIGGADRPHLRYAISDAERFARVLLDLGGMTPGEQIILRQPKLRELTDGLDLLGRRVADARRANGAAGGRIEIVLYYSGHADEMGLLIGDDRYSYQTLRDRLDQISADVRIAVLDACSSGAFTRLKGGRARRPFMVDESADMRGHAFLTSSAATEAAQESDRIRASYFTHYLVSGFRGAADSSGDGKVTLKQAYRFAFDETLGRTVHTRGGAQHPSYDIKLSGTGDVVMTDVRQTTATIVLGEELEGRFFIRTAAQELVVELYKPRGRRVELAVEPGTYDVRVEREKGAQAAKTEVADGARVLLDPRQFGAAAIEPAQARGGPPEPRFAVSGRNRVEAMSGMWSSGHSSSASGATVVTGTSLDVFAGVKFTRFIREDLAVTFSFEAFGVESGVSVAPGRVSTGTVGGLAMPLGIRWNPLRGDHRNQSFKPYILAGIGPVVGSSTGTLVAPGTVSTGSISRSTIGGRAGAGLDIHFARSFTLGNEVSYNMMKDFREPVGVHDNFNGLQVAVSFGWLFGKGY